MSEKENERHGRQYVEKMAEAMVLEQRQLMSNATGQAQKAIIIKAYQAGYNDAEQHHGVGAFAEQESD